MRSRTKSAVEARRKRRATKLAAFDEDCRAQAGGDIAGVDEAGRGPLAGPVVAAAVVLPPGARIPGVDDSKVLRGAERLEARERIERHAIAIGIGIVGPAEIDAVNILQATLRAGRAALRQLDWPIRMVVTDYLDLKREGALTRAEVDGDAKSLSIAAASIIAKTTRDWLMERYAEEYPGYGLERNKGYGSREHLEALARHGASAIHRLSFAGVGMFTDQPRPSRSFAALARLRQTNPAGFSQEAQLYLENPALPLIDREFVQLRRWMGLQP